MAEFSISNIDLIGISVCVPKRIIINSENTIFDKEEVNNFIKYAGVAEFRKSDDNTTSLNLAYESAKRLLLDMNVSCEEIEILILVTQTPDYLNIPSTSTILQHKLGLRKTTICFELPLGCSGFVYGMSVISSFMKAAKLKRGLLICADTITKISNSNDKSVSMLFGDAASSTLFEYNESAPSISFSLGTDGSGFESIIIPDGGYRSPFSNDSLIVKDFGERRDLSKRGCDLHLNGMDVFSFGISQVPLNVNVLFSYCSISQDDIDYAIFHQANKMMIENIRKKLNLPIEKVPYSIEKYGNTSSVSIPLTMATQLKNKLQNEDLRLLLSGFGVGLSWASCYLTTKRIFISDLVEY